MKRRSEIVRLPTSSLTKNREMMGMVPTVNMQGGHKNDCLGDVFFQKVLGSIGQRFPEEIRYGRPIPRKDLNYLLAVRFSFRKEEVPELLILVGFKAVKRGWLYPKEEAPV